MKFYMPIIFGVALVLPLASFANSNLAMQTQAIKLDELRSSMQLQIDALNTDLKATKETLGKVNNGLKDCSSTKGVYDPDRHVCKDLLYQETTNTHVLSNVKCKAKDCNNQAPFDVSDLITDESIALHAYIRWGGCGGDNPPQFSDLDLENPSTQSVDVYNAKTRSGDHGSYVRATYDPVNKTVKFDYGAWGDGIWCGSKGDGWNRHYINERGIQVITPEIVEVERPVKEMD